MKCIYRVKYYDKNRFRICYYSSKMILSINCQNITINMTVNDKLLKSFKIVIVKSEFVKILYFNRNYYIYKSEA